jgi:protein-L-isoaspartate(D-aspartate) O-methyltransferase
MCFLTEAQPVFTFSIDQHRLLATIESELRYLGLANGISPAVRQAYFDCPRHWFVGRYQIMRGGAVLQCQGDATAAEAAQHMQLIYSNTGLGHVDHDGRALASVNSPPSHALHMLELLELAPGQRVLEIGSGCGWLLAMAARAVGPQGHAVGVEILPSLAAQSRASLARCGVANAAVVMADGACGYPAGAPFDRVIFTAGLWDLPVAFFDQMAEGGLLVAPFQIKGGCNDLLVLRKMPGRRFRSQAALPAMFVDVSGGIAGLAHAANPLNGLPLWEKLCHREVLRMPMTFGMGGLGGLDENLFGWRTAAFRSFLQKIDPRMRIFTPDFDGDDPALRVLRASGLGAETVGIGLVDEPAGSLAVCTRGELRGYGTPAAALDFLAAYRLWTGVMMQGVEAFDVEIVEAGAATPARAGAWVEMRGATAMIWTLRRDRPTLDETIARLGRGGRVMPDARAENPECVD